MRPRPLEGPARAASRVPRLAIALTRRDRMESVRLLRPIARSLVPEYRLRWPDMAWWEDEAFRAYLPRFGELDGLDSGRQSTRTQPPRRPLGRSHPFAMGPRSGAPHGPRPTSGSVG